MSKKSTFDFWRSKDCKYVTEFIEENGRYSFGGRMYYVGATGMMEGYRHNFFPYKNREYIEFSKKDEFIYFIKNELEKYYDYPAKNAKKIIKEIELW